jgi:hypothetical protein
MPTLWTSTRTRFRPGAAVLAVLLCLLLGACTTSAPVQPVSSASLTATRAATAQATASGTARPASSGAATPGSATIVPTATPAPPPVAPAGMMLVQSSGDNPPGTNCCTVNQRTTPFDSPGAWNLNWNYDCSKLGRPGNFGVDVYRGDGSFVSLPPSVNEVGSGGQGTRSYTRPGVFYLVVNSVCRWSLSAVTSGQPTSTPGPAAQAGAPVSLPVSPSFAVPTPPVGAAPAPPTAASSAVTPAAISIVAPGAALAPVGTASPTASATP